ncbi:hypothetical protein NQ314_013852 [Rhamnusium bicolor]|uniref:Mannosyltransferase n=1 Tax=Rhamnusium bicolor TaxID=1586634 RepID=A0AAV8X5B7_9CUCU|nr:hypothetical protein NQ314_013852 [Rhamnusium bicolor]
MTKSQLSFRLRQNAPQPMRKESRKEIHKKPIKTQVSKVETSNTGLLFPAGDTAFKTLLSARFCAAIWSHISDCDETFNYWEPMHYLVFGKGLQTWEYSPEYGLRSYFYLMVHAAPAWIYHKLLQPNPLLMFYFIRCLLGLICAIAEVYFYKATCKEFGVHIGRICLAFQLFSAGMFISSTAFLPSSFAMYTCAAACAAWWQQKFALAVFFIALGSLLGWPFAALLGVPIAFDMLLRKKLYADFAAWFLYPIYPLVCLCGAITVDVIQKLSFRVWSIFKKMPTGTHYLDKTIFVMIVTITVTSWLGVSRVFALYRNYHAPFDLMMELNRYPVEAKIPDKAQVNVCIGKDWYRYPSSFFLPNPNWNIRFIKSEFNGMLPAPYTGNENATTIIHPYFNDKNEEEPSLYFDLSKCHFLLDLDLGKETNLEPIYANKKDKWKVVKSYPFLNIEMSNKYFRAFYIPFLSDRYIVYGNFSLLQSTKLKIK